MKGIFILLLCTVLFCGCAGQGQQPSRDHPPMVENGPELPHPDVAQGAELMALAESEEAAKALAEQYGITLVSYSYEIAVFTTDRDPFEVVEQGKEEGWPELSVNYVTKIDRGEEDAPVQ